MTLGSCSMPGESSSPGERENLTLPLSLRTLSKRLPKLPVHSHARPTSPLWLSRMAARTLALPSTTALTRFHSLSRRWPRNSERRTSSRSWPIDIQGSGASPRLYKAACVESRSSVVATSSGMRAISAFRAIYSALMYARAAAVKLRMKIGSRYAMRESRRWRRKAQMMGSLASELLE